MDLKEAFIRGILEKASKKIQFIIIYKPNLPY